LTVYFARASVVALCAIANETEAKEVMFVKGWARKTCVFAKRTRIISLEKTHLYNWSTMSGAIEILVYNSGSFGEISERGGEIAIGMSRSRPSLRWIFRASSWFSHSRIVQGGTMHFDGC